MALLKRIWAPFGALGAPAKALRVPWGPLLGPSGTLEHLGALLESLVAPFWPSDVQRLRGSLGPLWALQGQKKIRGPC